MAVIFFFVNSIDEKYINQKLGPRDVYVRIVYSYQGFHLHLKFFHHKKDVLHSELNVQKNFILNLFSFSFFEMLMVIPYLLPKPSKLC